MKKIIYFGIFVLIVIFSTFLVTALPSGCYGPSTKSCASFVVPYENPDDEECPSGNSCNSPISDCVWQKSGYCSSTCVGTIDCSTKTDEAICATAGCKWGEPPGYIIENNECKYVTTGAEYTSWNLCRVKIPALTDRVCGGTSIKSCSDYTYTNDNTLDEYCYGQQDGCIEGTPFSCEPSLTKYCGGQCSGTIKCENVILQADCEKYGCRKICGTTTCTSVSDSCCGASCKSLNTDLDNCGSCGNVCSDVDCGNYATIPKACNSGSCVSSAACKTSCGVDTQTTDCKSGYYCSGNACIDTCEFNVSMDTRCVAKDIVGGCTQYDKILVNISYRGKCADVTKIQIDLGEGVMSPFPTGDGTTFCNIQSSSKASMTGITLSDPGLEDTTVTKTKPLPDYVLPVNLGIGYAACNNKNLTNYYASLSRLSKDALYTSGIVSDVTLDKKNITLVFKCGDDVCSPIIGENTNTCFRDCFKDGWETRDNVGWSLPSDKILRATAPGLTLTSTYAVDIKAGLNYTLAYNVVSNGCTVKFDFNDGNCTTVANFTTAKCFDMDAVVLDSEDSTGYSQKVIKIDSNGNATNGVFFRDVKLRLRTEGSCTDISIANLSLMETTFAEENITYNYSKLGEVSGKITSTGCCPNSYCWDGQVCQDSKQWMDNATLPGKWNSLNISNWTDKHVNLSNISDTVSYRCIINNDVGTANWVPSRVKYDWNFEKSGYCARETDCFVSETFPKQGSTHSIGCIHHGEVVSDAQVFDQGNHYCHLGNWTTKSYIVATFLQNISEGMHYSLQCYDDANITYNLNDRTVDDVNPILSSCVLMQKESALKENVITGIVFNNVGDVEDFLNYLKDEYALMYGSTAPADIISSCLKPSAVKVTDSNFSECIKRTGASTRGGLYVYYETTYNYLIFSDSPVDGLTKQTVWDQISGFFKGLFSSPILTEPFTSINYTTNYDKIYVLRNSTVNVTALEEAKYDEVEGHIATIMYVKYSGTYNETNPLHQGVMYKSVNDTMFKDGNTNVDVVVTVSNTTDPVVEQEIIIKSQEPSGLWKYFTSILRTR